MHVDEILIQSEDKSTNQPINQSINHNKNDQPKTLNQKIDQTLNTLNFLQPHRNLSTDFLTMTGHTPAPSPPPPTTNPAPPPYTPPSIPPPPHTQDI